MRVCSVHETSAVAAVKPKCDYVCKGQYLDKAACQNGFLGSEIAKHAIMLSQFAIILKANLIVARVCVFICSFCTLLQCHRFYSLHRCPFCFLSELKSAMLVMLSFIALNADLKSIIQIVVNPLPLIGLRHVVNRKALQ